MVGSASFIGGMNVPAVIGRANATVPLAELVLDDQTLTLRPRGFGRVLMTDFVVRLDDIAAAFKLRGEIMTAGVGIRIQDGATVFFWTWTQKDAVLAALAERGVQVEPGTHRAKGLWSLRRPESGAIVPTLPAVLKTLAPVLALAGTAVMIVLLSTTESWWMRLVLLIIWAISMVSALGLWWKGRPRKP